MKCVNPLPLPARTRVSLLAFAGNGQAKNRKLPRPGYIHAVRFIRIRQVECLAVLTPINFRLISPGLTHVAAGLFDDVVGVKPMFKMPAAELTLCVFLVAGALARLLILDLMIRQLRGRRNFCGVGCRQWSDLLSLRPASLSRQAGVILLENQERCP